MIADDVQEFLSEITYNYIELLEDSWTKSSFVSVVDKVFSGNCQVEIVRFSSGQVVIVVDGKGFYITHGDVLEHKKVTETYAKLLADNSALGIGHAYRKKYIKYFI